jgi:hypothetical protein
MLNFTWWVNRKDANGSNIFQGGFLGLDNIGVFDRSSALPTGGRIDQSDGTSWMAAYCLQMLKISLELAQKNPAYQDMATKFFEHFLRIAHAMGHMGGEHSLWDEEDGFFYDVLHLPDGTEHKLKVRSMVGLLPLFAVDTIEPEVLDKMPDFERRMNWFMKHRGHLAHSNIASVHLKGLGERRLFAILNKDRLARVLRRMLDPEEFLSDHGVRSISKYHEKNPYIFERYGQRWEVGYWPAEARSGLFGGNSNWRGPLWLPVNYLIIESLQKFHHYYGDDFKVEMPTGSGVWMNLHEVARELSRRMVRMFTKDEQHRRPIHVRDSAIWETEHWRDHLLFYEYFHGDTGAGLGASHQTGWTGLVAKLIQQLGAV